MPMDPQREALAFAPVRRARSAKRAPFAHIPAAIKAELFTVPDPWVAEAVGCSVATVCQYRRLHSIPAADHGGAPRPGRVEWVAEMKRRLAPTNP